MNVQLQREPASRPGEPTESPPGSPGKIRVLMERAARREALFHPHDNLKRQFPERTEEEEVFDDVEVMEVVEELEECDADLVS